MYSLNWFVEQNEVIMIRPENIYVHENPVHTKAIA